MSDISALKALITLTPKEAEIIYFKCKGLSHEKISEKLVKGAKTVQSQSSSALKKLGIETKKKTSDGETENRTAQEIGVDLVRGRYCEALEEYIKSPDEDFSTERWRKICAGLLYEIDLNEEKDKEETDKEKPPVEFIPPGRRRREEDEVGWRNRGIIIGGVIIILCLCSLVGYRLINWYRDFVAIPRPTQTPTATATHTPLPPTNTPTIPPTPTETLIPTITNTSPPTNTPVPTDTPTITHTPLPSATPEPILFEDDFEDGLDPAWVILDGDPIISNGRLNANEHTWLAIGLPTWTNYSVEFFGKCSTYEYVQGSPCITGVRAQDKDNMVAVKWSYYDLEWYVVENGNWDNMPDTRYRKVNNNPYDLIITANQNNYNYNVRGENKPFSREIYPQGYIVFWLRAGSWIDEFRVIALP